MTENTTPQRAGDVLLALADEITRLPGDAGVTYRRDWAARIREAAALSASPPVAAPGDGPIGHISRHTAETLSNPADLRYLETTVYAKPQASGSVPIYLAADQMRDYARAAIRALSALSAERGAQSAPVAAPGDGNLPMYFCLSEAKALVSFFGGNNADVSVQEFPAREWPDGKAEAGKWAWCVDCPEEGGMWLGPHDVDADEHATCAAATATPVAVDGEAMLRQGKVVGYVRQDGGVNWYTEGFARETSPAAGTELYALPAAPASKEAS